MKLCLYRFTKEDLPTLVDAGSIGSTLRVGLSQAFPPPEEEEEPWDLTEGPIFCLFLEGNEKKWMLHRDATKRLLMANGMFIDWKKVEDYEYFVVERAISWIYENISLTFICVALFHLLINIQLIYLWGANPIVSIFFALLYAIMVSHFVTENKL